MFYRGYVYGCGDAHVCVCVGHFLGDSQSAGQQRIKVERNITENNLDWRDERLVKSLLSV